VNESVEGTETKTEAPLHNKKFTNKTWRQERPQGKFLRSFQLPEDVNFEAAVGATMNEGVLTLQFLKKAADEHFQIEIR